MVPGSVAGFADRPAGLGEQGRDSLRVVGMGTAGDGGSTAEATVGANICVLERADGQDAAGALMLEQRQAVDHKPDAARNQDGHRDHAENGVNFRPNATWFHAINLSLQEPSWQAKGW